MQLLALVEGPDHVCYRYRLGAFAGTLAENDWILTSLPLAQSLAGFLRQLKQAADADAVVLQRRLLPWWQLHLLRRSAKTLLYDFDDAVFLRDSNARKPAASARRARRFRATIRAADAVTAGNAFLVRQAAEVVSPQRLHFFPACVQPGLYPAARHDRRAGEAKLVWIGSRSTMSSLDLARPGLAAAAARLPEMELRVICDAFPALPGLRVSPRLWSSESEARELADADVGISWLPDHPWSLGKCGLKVLQYMAVGLPVVANPVGVHREMVLHGETGLLAATSDQWADAVCRLAADPALRRRMGEAGRRLVERQYNATLMAGRFAALLDTLVAARTRAHCPRP